MFRALKAGHAICYEPGAVLSHEHRATREDALQQAEDWGTGFGAFLARTGTAYPEERLYAGLLRNWLLVSHYGRRVIASYFDRAIPREMVLRTIRGLRRGPAAYRESLRPNAAPRG
jgi:hypothetical protein